MLIAHVEQQGVWTIDGGMARLAAAMTDLATPLGAAIRTCAPVAEILVLEAAPPASSLASGERIEADAVICAADFAALSSGAVRAGGPPRACRGRGLPGGRCRR